MSLLPYIDLLSLVFGIALGAVITWAILYSLVVRKNRLKSNSRMPELQAEVPTSLVARSEIEKARKELKLLKMERDYLSSALARIYEAEAKGLINKEERMSLSQKYKSQLKEVEDKIARAQTIVDVADLEDAKAELLNLVNQKISQIDERLEELKQKIAPIIPSFEQEISHEVSAPLPKERKEKSEEVSKKPEIMDDKLKKVVQDVNEVMAKLEQMDLEE